MQNNLLLSHWDRNKTGWIKQRAKRFTWLFPFVVTLTRWLSKSWIDSLELVNDTDSWNRNYHTDGRILQNIRSVLLLLWVYLVSNLMPWAMPQVYCYIGWNTTFTLEALHEKTNTSLHLMIPRILFKAKQTLNIVVKYS